MTSEVYAFPRPLPRGTYVPDEALRILRDSAGMTLRDYFAAAAMQGAMSLPGGMSGVTPADAAFFAYSMADAMLAERSK